jgi:hypothetical protein
VLEYDAGTVAQVAILTKQFIRSKSAYMSADLIASTNLGHKDITKGLFEIWKEIFQAPKTKKNAVARVMNEKLQEELTLLGNRFTSKLIISDNGPKHRIPSHFDTLYSLLEEQNDYQKIIEGCHENFLSVHFNDPMLTKVWWFN